MRQLELVLVGITAVVFAVIPKPPAAALPMAVFIAVCIVGWSAFGVWRVRGDPTLLDRWGLRPTAHLWQLSRVLAPLLGGMVVVGVAWAVVAHRPLLPQWLWLSLLLYPLWGLVQQWLVQALLVDNVRELTGASLPWLMALGAVGFGAIHFEHPPLVVATAGMGAVYVYLFQSWPNLWPLAVCHGWLGSLFYPWVLELNPTAQMMEAVVG